MSEANDPLDPSQIDAYKFTKAQFDEEWRSLGKPTAAAPVEDPPRDADGRFTTEPLGDAYKMTDRDFKRDWDNWGRPTTDGHPVACFTRLSESRRNGTNAFGLRPNHRRSGSVDPSERETV